METLVLLGGFLCVAGLGFLPIRQLERFFRDGGFAPYWSREEKHTDQVQWAQHFKQHRDRCGEAAFRPQRDHYPKVV